MLTLALRVTGISFRLPMQTQGDERMWARQVELLRSDNVVSEAAKREGRTLEQLGIDPVAMATIVPSYLWRFRKAGQFQGTVVGNH